MKTSSPNRVSGVNKRPHRAAVRQAVRVESHHTGLHRDRKRLGVLPQRAREAGAAMAIRGAAGEMENEAGGEKMKTTQAQKWVWSLLCGGLLATSGCYTVLMHPSVMTSSEETSTTQGYSHGDFTSDISYTQNCLSCHTQAELDDRYYDMQRAGILYAHGMSIDPYGWRRPATSIPWWDGVIAPVPGSAVSVSPSTSESVPRRRTSGNTRGDEGGRTAAAAPATTPTPAPAAPPAPAAISDTRTNTSNAAPPSSSGRTRTSTSTSKEPPPRKAGSTRGTDPK